MKKWWIIGGSVVLVIIILGVVGIAVSNSKREARLFITSTSYKNAGLPWTVEDLPSTIQVPDEENAAIQIRQLAASLEMSPIDNDRSLLEEALKIQDYNSAKPIIEKLKPAIDLAREAGQQPYLNFGHDWNQGSLVKLPEYAIIKDAVRLLSLNAEYNQLIGNDTQAVADLQSAYHLSNIVNQEPIIIGSLVSIACASITTRAYQNVADLRVEQGKPIQPLIDSFERTQLDLNFPESLRYEAYMAVATLRNIHQFGNFFETMNVIVTGASEMDEFKNPAKDGYPKRPLEQEIFIETLEFWTRTYPKTQEPDFEVLTFTRDMSKEIDRLSNGSPTEQAMTIFFPVFDQYAQAIVRAQATRDLTLAYLHALQLKQKTGTMPTSLQDFPPNLPLTDPFSKQPYKLAEIEDFWRIYSVGPNQIDEGGLNRQEWSRLRNVQSESDDIGVPKIPETPTPPAPGDPATTIPPPPSPN